MRRVIQGLSHDGRRLLYAPSNGRDSTVFVWNNPADDQSTPIEWPLIPDAKGPYRDISLMSFSPDDKWVAFHAARRGPGGAGFIVPVGGGTPVTAGPGIEVPFFLEDPRRLYTWNVGTDGELDDLGFAAFDPVTGHVTSPFQRIKFGFDSGAPRIGNAHVTPDGRWLIFEWTQQEGDIYVADLDR